MLTGDPQVFAETVAGVGESDGGTSTDLVCHQKPSSLQQQAPLSREEKPVALLSRLRLFKARSGNGGDCFAKGRFLGYVKEYATDPSLASSCRNQKCSGKRFLIAYLR